MPFSRTTMVIEKRSNAMFTIKQLERYADVLWWGLTTAKKAPFKKKILYLFAIIDLPFNWLKSFLPLCWPGG